MKRSFVILLAFVAYCSTQGQTSSLDTNNIKMSIRTNGDIGWEYDSGDWTVTSEAPILSNKRYLFASTLWMGGIDDDANLHIAANTYGQSGQDFWAGPVATSYDANYDATYDRTWIINIDQIENHISNYASSGYIMPEVIEHWPANGNSSNGESSQLAPYNDLNGNNLYEPLLGEHPLIRGDKAMYIIYNDTRTTHIETGGEAIGAEIHLMMYGYNSSDENIHNTIFMHYSIYNRGDADLVNFRVGSWIDWDLGYYDDDFIGCDIGRNLAFVYNGDATDESEEGYGTNPPAAGLIMLNNDLEVHLTHQNNGDSIYGNPTTAVGYYNYISGKWLDGSDYTINGESTTLMYPGSTDANFPELDLTEAASNNSPSDRRSISALMVDEFNVGTSICLDYAYVFAWDTTNTHLENVEFLRERVDSVQAFYDSHFVDCSDFSVDISNLGIEELLEGTGFESFYLANLNQWQIRSKDVLSSPVQVVLSNVQGQVIDIQTWSADYDFIISKENKSTGTYFVSLKLKDQVIGFPIIIQ